MNRQTEKTITMKKNRVNKNQSKMANQMNTNRKANSNEERQR